MECLYIPGLEKKEGNLVVDGDEARHIKALRLKSGEEVLITNGDGLTCCAEFIEYKNKKQSIVSCREFFHNLNEPTYRLGLAIGILDNRDKLELALEKGVEMGITDFIPLICDYSQKRKVNTERLKSKSIAAMKQCRRSRLININTPVSIENLINSPLEFGQFIVADIEGSTGLSDFSKSDSLIIIGPEGGFSKSELNQFKHLSDMHLLKLSTRRLRAETAAMMSLSLVTHFIEFK